MQIIYSPSADLSPSHDGWRWLQFIALFLALTLWTSCSTVRTSEARGDQQGQSAVAGTVPPRFLTGPMSILLTNGIDFTARLDFTNATASSEFVSGNLFQQEGKILFVPMADGPSMQGTPAGSFRFLWDVARNKGYIISEALHGYVSYLAADRYELDPIQRPVVAAGVTQVDARPCREEDVMVRSSRGEATAFLVCRDEATGIAAEIKPISSTVSATAQLVQLNPDRLDPSLFSLHPGYVAYNSVDAMVRVLSRKPRVMPYSSSGQGDRTGGTGRSSNGSGRSGR